MKEISLKGLDQSLYYKKLDNGLDVFLIPYTNKSNYTMHYISKYGSVNTTFKPVNKKKTITVPAGIAHFLEHKMFESEDGVDPFSFAAKTGTYANASTYYKTTRYYFEGNSGFRENLDYLLDFVNTPYFTEENVEKEKGIIAEEIKQYDDEIGWFLDEEVRKALFHKDPTRLDIAGTVESINKIDKDILYDTYYTYYQPSNMILMISGSFDKDEALEIITNNESLNNAKTNQPIEEKKEKEPVEVKDKEVNLTFNIVNTKVAYAIKIPTKDIKDKYLFNLYLGLFSSIKFGLSSNFREKMKKQKLMTSFYIDREIMGDYIIMSFVADSEKPREFIDEIKKELQEINIEEEDIERVKKVWISSEVIMVDNIALTLDNILYDITSYDKIIDNKIEIFRSLNLETLKETIDNIDFTNSSLVIVTPKS